MGDAGAEDKMKKSTMYVFGIVLLIVIGGYLIMKNNDGNITGNVTGGSRGDVNEITLSIKNYNYYPNTIKVKAGETVRIRLDESVVGCYRSFTIRDFGISKYLATPNDYVEFTPTEKGTYRFACSMGMGTGTLIVE